VRRDQCRLIDAAKSGDARRCESVTDPWLRGRCAATIAELAGAPDSCPFLIKGREDLGREPSCVALAARDARLCSAAEGGVARSFCLALATRAPSLCDELPAPAEQQRCVDDLRFWAPAIPAAGQHAPFDLRGHWSATVSGTAENVIEGGWGFDASRGIVLVERADGAHLTFGAAETPTDLAIAAPPLDASWMRGEVVVPGDARNARIVFYEFNIPGRAHLRIAATAAPTIRVRIIELERRRAGTVEIAVEGPLQKGVFTRAGLRTFVRDVVHVP
jgi:hypothetical protein